LSIHNPKRGSASYVSARRWAPEFEVSVKYGWGHHLRRGVFVDKGDQQMRTNKTSMELERTSLDEQAKALGLGRSTAWTITKNKHKLGRLSAKTIDRILSNPQTPPAVRVVARIHPFAWNKWIAGHLSAVKEALSVDSPV
jgi:hypothetical protein